jgi:hypothetical protein
MPVIALRLLDGRVGSTLLMRLLATSQEIALEREYPEGERRYLSYCLRVANWVGTPWNPAVHLDATDLHFGEQELGGPIPFTPSLVDIARLAPAMLTAMWEAVSNEIRRSAPSARYYAEKLVGDAQVLYQSEIPLRLIDLVRDPRDVFCSIRSFSGGGAGFGRTADQTDGEFLEQMAADHLRRLREMARAPSNVPRISVRYEDFVTNVPAHAALLGDWLGVRLDADKALKITHIEQQHRTSGSAAESIGRWRRELSPELAARAWSILGEALTPLGYTAE